MEEPVDQSDPCIIPKYIYLHTFCSFSTFTADPDSSESAAQMSFFSLRRNECLVARLHGEHIVGCVKKNKLTKKTKKNKNKSQVATSSNKQTDETNECLSAVYMQEINVRMEIQHSVMRSNNT